MKGEKGEKGDPGEDGADGMDGAPGADGMQGPQGERGLVGPKGDPGNDGADGQDGVKGDTGDVGPRGPAGPPGPPGRDLTVSAIKVKDARAGGSSSQIRNASISKSGNTITLTRTYQEEEQCFLGGTQVKMANGSFKVVEDIQVGDMLASPDGPRQVVALDNGFLRDKGKPETHIVFRHQGKDTEVVCTANHPFLLPDGTFGAVSPNAQNDHREFTPIVDGNGNRELWYRGNRGNVKVLGVGSEVATLDGGRAEIVSVQQVIREAGDAGVATFTPVTGGILILKGGILASAGYDPAAAAMTDPKDVVAYFTGSRQAVA
ncbi:MAG: hypothetical protein OXU75_14525 [Deltaproteobacteria bacterium]|nr:hypothetical protein [Deltaproteobacteria bacterium]